MKTAARERVYLRLLVRHVTENCHSCQKLFSQTVRYTIDRSPRWHLSRTPVMTLQVDCRVLPESFAFGQARKKTIEQLGWAGAGLSVSGPIAGNMLSNTG